MAHSSVWGADVSRCGRHTSIPLRVMAGPVFTVLTACTIMAMVAAAISRPARPRMRYLLFTGLVLFTRLAPYLYHSVTQDGVAQLVPGLKLFGNSAAVAVGRHGFV